MAGGKRTALDVIGGALACAALATAAGAIAPTPKSVPASTNGTPMGAPATTAPAPAAATGPARRSIHLSPAGVEIAKKWLGSPDPQIKALMGQRAGLQGQIAAAITAPKVDLDRIAALMSQASSIESGIRARQNAVTISMLREMAEPDRVSYLHQVTGIPTPPPAPAPGTPAPPKPH